MKKILFMIFIITINILLVSIAMASEPANKDKMLLIKGGTFQMGSPDSELWRSKDETLHKVTVSDFYMGQYEVTQKEYKDVTGKDPSTFKGDDLPVENLTWYEALEYCNALSTKEGLTPVYKIDGVKVTWDRSANGYRLPTEAEWEYACRAGTTTPFNTETSIGPDEANYYGHYPYLIEENYFTQDKLSTKPGIYRGETVAANSFKPNKLGLYNMHGNVSEWVWDNYGEYSSSESTDPTGAGSGIMHVSRGGGWNDFAKNMRSAYRATTPADSQTYNLGFRVVRNGVQGTGTVESINENVSASAQKKTLIVFFSWGGTTRGIAKEIQKQSMADIVEIKLAKPYSDDYDTVLKEAQRDQKAQARPELAINIDNFDQYDRIILGYPNWWASIPMPIASFLEKYNMDGKTIIPFCSHGGGRFGQSLTAISKLAPKSKMGKGLSVHYSGGSSLPYEIAKWMKENGLK